MILLKLMARRGYPTPAPRVYGDTHTYDYLNGLRIIIDDGLRIITEPRSGRFTVYLYGHNDCRVITGTLIDVYRRLSDWIDKGERSGMKELNLAVGYWDVANTFYINVNGERVACSLIKTRGVYWARSAVGCRYTSTPLENGDVVLIDGEQYRIRVIGDDCEVAIFDKVAYEK